MRTMKTISRRGRVKESHCLMTSYRGSLQSQGKGDGVRCSQGSRPQRGPHLGRCWPLSRMPWQPSREGAM